MLIKTHLFNLNDYECISLPPNTDIFELNDELEKEGYTILTKEDFNLLRQDLNMNKIIF